jgi:hypothetical protein
MRPGYVWVLLLAMLIAFWTYMIHLAFVWQA